jgi:hypothetical protein
VIGPFEFEGCVGKVAGDFRRLVHQILAAVPHPVIQLVGVGEDGTLIAAKMVNGKAIYFIPSLDSTATAVKMLGNGLPTVQPPLRKLSISRS